jgi:5-methylcytosine-specific restriction endonuclease McrA
VRINLELGELGPEQREPSAEGELPREGYMERRRQKRPRLKLDPEKYETLKNEVLERDGWRCQDCGSAKMLEVHHVKPRSKLGHDASDNLITLCVDCHGRRHGINR